MKEKTWWFLSAIVSTVFIIMLVSLWTRMNQHEVKPTQLINEKAVDDYLKKHWEQRADESALHAEPMVKIKTGIFIQSLKFFNSTEVSLTGYLPL